MTNNKTPVSDFAVQFQEVLSSDSRFLVISHQRPDGDAIGSTLAMGLALKSLGKSAVLWNEDPIPSKFAFLPGADLLKQVPESSPGFDAVISVDNANKSRLGRAVELVGEVPIWINIDHHASNEKFGTLNLVDSGSPATGEILFRLFKACGIRIDRPMATSLFVAISTDTGSFNYSGTTADCFRTAAELVETGLDIGELSQRVYESHSLSRFMLLKRVLSKTQFRADNRISFCSIVPEDYQQAGAAPEDSEGIIDMIRAIDTVVVSVIFEEVQGGKIRISLRSKSKQVDVNRVAQKFGGGGHTLAAGARTPGRLSEVQEKVLCELESILG